MQNLPALTNFCICVLVTLNGFYWLKYINKKNEHERRYIFRAYLCWWLSWVVWTVTWAIISFTEREISHPRAVFALSDLNAIFLVAVYFILTRGDGYKPITALLDISYLCTVLAAGYIIFWFLLPQRFDSLQMGWGLCLSAVSTLLVGWAFNFRYKTRAVLVIGFVYAFAQPFAFDAIQQKAPPADVQPVLEAFKFVLAIFKVLWATIVTTYFTLPPATNENITVGTGEGVLVPNLKKLPMSLYIQTFVLLTAVIVFLGIILFQRFPQVARDQIFPILGALSALVTIATVLARLVKWLKDNLKEEEPGL